MFVKVSPKFTMLLWCCCHKHLNHTSFVQSLMKIS